MEKQMEQFRDDVDAWVKQIRHDQDSLAHVPAALEEHDGNIQHNYELLREVRDDMEDLREELKLLKMIQIKLIGKKLKV